LKKQWWVGDVIHKRIKSEKRKKNMLGGRGGEKKGRILTTK